MYRCGHGFAPNANTICCMIVVQALRHDLIDSSDWDILVAHYLGVDHVGHTFSVHSPEMLAKVQEMDAELLEVRSCEVLFLTVCITIRIASFVP